MQRKKTVGNFPVGACGLICLALFLGQPSWAGKDPTPAAVYEGKTAREWLAALKDTSLSLRSDVTVNPGEALIALGKDAVPVLAHELSISDDKQVVEILRRIGAPAVPTLCSCLEDRTPEFRYYILTTLGRMGAEARAAVPALIESLRDTESTVDVGGNKMDLSRFTMNILRRIGAPSKDSLPALVNALRASEHRAMQQMAAEMLGLLGPDARSAVPVLAQAMDPRTPEVAYRAIKALGSIGGGEAVKVLADRIDALPETGAGYRLRSSVALALGKTKDPSALPVLVELLKREKAHTRGRVINAFSNFGDEALDLLVPMLSIKERRIRNRAARAIGSLGPRGKRAVGHLRKALKDQDRNFRSAAACALGEIGPEAASAVPDLIRDINNSNGAIGALGRIGPGAKEAVPALIRVLEDKDREWVDRHLAAESLGRIGADARSAIPALEAAIKEHPNPDSVVRGSAEEALKRIRRPSESDR